MAPELRAPGNVMPDGTVMDAPRTPRGYWEAKDTHDDLDSEFQRKINRGYPSDNIIFEDSRTAVLMRHGTAAMRVDMSNAASLHRLITAFLNYVGPEIEAFRRAQQFEC